MSGKLKDRMESNSRICLLKRLFFGWISALHSARIEVFSFSLQKRHTQVNVPFPMFSKCIETIVPIQYNKSILELPLINRFSRRFSRAFVVVIIITIIIREALMERNQYNIKERFKQSKIKRKKKEEKTETGEKKNEIHYWNNK